MTVSFKIGNLLISEKKPPVIIAEIGINHNGSLDAAIAIADSDIRSVAEIIKHQTHVVDDEMSEEAKKTIAFAFASVVSTREIKKGEKLSKNNIFVRRPGGGDYKIKDLTKLYGKIAKKNIKNNVQIKKKFIQ